MDRLSSLELHEELNETLKEARKRSLRLWGLIRKIPSVNSVLLKKRDDSKEQLDVYVNKLSECLLDFRSDMVEAMERTLKERQDELTLLKKGYEDDVETLLMLCTEAEKMVQFGKTLDNMSDREDAESLLQAFYIFLSRRDEDCCAKNLFNFTVKKTLEIDDITPGIFGHSSSDVSGLNIEHPSQNSCNGTLQMAVHDEGKVRDRNSDSLQDAGTQTVVLCADEFVQTEDSGIQHSGGKQDETFTHNAVPVPVHSVESYRHQSSPPPGFIKAVPDMCNISPVVGNVHPIPAVSPGIVYGQCAVVGSTPSSIQSYNIIQVPQECQQVVPVCSTSFEDPSILYCGRNLSPVNNVKNADNANDFQTSGSKGVGMVAGQNCPPGFSPVSVPFARNSRIPGNNPSEYLDRAILSPVNEINCESVTPYGRSVSSHLSSNVSPATYNGALIKQGPLDAIAYHGNVYDRSSVYVPPDIPNFLKELHKQFDSPATGSERKPLRRPYKPPAEGRNETFQGYHHSTPIKGSQPSDVKPEANNIDKKPMISSLQSIGQNLINSSNNAAEDWDATNERDVMVDDKMQNPGNRDTDFAKRIKECDEIPPLDCDDGQSKCDNVKLKYPLSSEEKNRQVLKSQTNWCKGYLSQMLSSPRHTNKTKSMNNEVSKAVEDWDIESSDLTESSKNITYDTEGSSVLDLSKVSMKEDAGYPVSESINDSYNKKLIMGENDSGVYVSEKDKSEQSKEIDAKETKDILMAVLAKDENKTPVDDIHGTCFVQEPASSKPSERLSDDEKRTNIQNQTNNLNKTVKQFLGESKNTSQKGRRLGALQAHWLENGCGKGSFADKDAKLLFKFSSNLHFPIGISTNSEKNILVTDTGNHVVKKFDESGKLICEFGRKLPMKRPSAIVVNDVDDIFVKDDVCIHVFNKHGEYVKDIGKADFKRPFGLAMTPAKRLLVLETHLSYPSLVHLSQDGLNVLRFLYAPLVNAHPMSKCRFIGVSDNNVIVSDLGISQVYITNLEGVYMKRFGSYGSGLMQFFEPSGISVDNYGNVVVGDSKNNRIQIYRYDGSYTGLVRLDEPIQRPSGIHLTSDNKLLVVNFLEQCIGVYQL